MIDTIRKIVVASHNEGKVREIRDLLQPFGVETVSVAELDLPEPDETGVTFAENAELKAKAAADASGLIALSDDSGLAIDALDGAPGIYAARWAELPEGGRNFDYAMARVFEEMQKVGGPKTARFICALSLAFPHGDIHTFEGKVEGEIVWPPRGDKGFGYDPIFQALGDQLTFAEIDPDEKHAKSHRADAFAKFIKTWFPDG
ncbi:MAG: RdgB/HAM1 family non-canonical purine NTP pyrophosphatase [Acidimicrobiales bacterium]|nr:RdgB/HAM1 family non-canonical purine NTP pyrophosphatase [Hyphomonadaceae bacterium]RZV42194.1 MAG: RdgB/HAM1 family non-canonical purine NTP pyrophosphatase [Acidimicrobiales bacterium]